jgi:hypothetical protein
VYFFLISFPLLGAGIKYIDDAFDEKRYNKKIAIILAPILGLLWSYSMIIDQISATILLAVILGVLFKGKIDNKAHLIGFVIISSIILFIGINLMFLPLIMLIASVILDEVGNDVIEYNKGFFNENRLCHKCFITFFDQRWLTKLTILYMVFIGLFPWYFFLAILLFDSAYLFVRMYSRSQYNPRQVTC